MKKILLLILLFFTFNISFASFLALNDGYFIEVKEVENIGNNKYRVDFEDYILESSGSLNILNDYGIEKLDNEIILNSEIEIKPNDKLLVGITKSNPYFVKMGCEKGKIIPIYSNKINLEEFKNFGSNEFNFIRNCDEFDKFFDYYNSKYFLSNFYFEKNYFHIYIKIFYGFFIFLAVLIIYKFTKKYLGKTT